MASIKTALITMMDLWEWCNGRNRISTLFANIYSGIPPGDSLTYNFTVQQNGTYWIHSHVMGQYPDGLRSPFIIRNPNEPYQYDEDITVTLSDWYHKANEGRNFGFHDLDQPYWRRTNSTSSFNK